VGVSGVRLQGCAGLPLLTFPDKYAITLAMITVAASIFIAACFLRLARMERDKRRMEQLREVTKKDSAAAHDMAGNSALFPDQATSRRLCCLNISAAGWIEFRERLHHSMMILAFLFYMRLVILTLQSFRCRDQPDVQDAAALADSTSDTIVARASFLTEDGVTRCLASAHIGLLFADACILPLFVVGFPVYCFVLLTRAFGMDATEGVMKWARKKSSYLREPLSTNAASDAVVGATAVIQAGGRVPAGEMYERSFGFLFVHFRRGMYLSCLQAFFAQAWFAAASVFTDDSRSNTALFLFGFCAFLQSAYIATSLPFIKMRVNLQKLLVMLVQMASAIIQIALQTQGQRDAFFITLCVLLASLILLVVALRRSLTKRAQALRTKHLLPLATDIRDAAYVEPVEMVHMKAAVAAAAAKSVDLPEPPSHDSVLAGPRSLVSPSRERMLLPPLTVWSPLSGEPAALDVLATAPIHSNPSPVSSDKNYLGVPCGSPSSEAASPKALMDCSRRRRLKVSFGNLQPSAADVAAMIVTPGCSSPLPSPCESTTPVEASVTGTGTRQLAALSNVQRAETPSTEAEAWNTGPLFPPATGMCSTLLEKTRETLIFTDVKDEAAGSQEPAALVTRRFHDMPPPAHSDPPSHISAIATILQQPPPPSPQPAACLPSRARTPDSQASQSSSMPHSPRRVSHVFIDTSPVRDRRLVNHGALQSAFPSCTAALSSSQGKRRATADAADILVMGVAARDSSVNGSPAMRSRRLDASSSYPSQFSTRPIELPQATVPRCEDSGSNVTASRSDGRSPSTLILQSRRHSLESSSSPKLHLASGGAIAHEQEIRPRRLTPQDIGMRSASNSTLPERKALSSLVAASHEPSWYILFHPSDLSSPPLHTSSGRPRKMPSAVIAGHVMPNL
jgi:uncharacterized membrane protein YidH (DUF202 family)